MKGTFETVSLIGFGNVGSHLAKHLEKSGVNISHVYNRNVQANEKIATSTKAIITNKISTLPKDQLVLICVSDSAIPEIVEQIHIDTPIAYTSGSIAIETLPKRKNIGVFYPLQTFSKDRAIDLSQVPFLIEASNNEFGNQLYNLASMLSNSVSYANSQKRKELHLAAVWVNNFTNHIVHLAQKYTKENNVDFSLLVPLLKETIDKLDYLTARDAQTGPARRGDTSIIKEHISKLQGTELELYKLISKSIQNTYSKDGEL